MLEVKKGNKSFYVGDSEEEPLAEMTFVHTGDNLIIIDHTCIRAIKRSGCRKAAAERAG